MLMKQRWHIVIVEVLRTSRLLVRIPQRKFSKLFGRLSFGEFSGRFNRQRNKVTFQSACMSDQISSSFQFQFNIVVMFESNNPVRPTPICCKLSVFVQKTVLIKQYQLANNEVVPHCFLVRILFCFLTHNLIIATGRVTCS